MASKIKETRLGSTCHVFVAWPAERLAPFEDDLCASARLVSLYSSRTSKPVPCMGRPDGLHDPGSADPRWPLLSAAVQSITRLEKHVLALTMSVPVAHWKRRLGTMMLSVAALNEWDQVSQPTVSFDDLPWATPGGTGSANRWMERLERNPLYLFARYRLVAPVHAVLTPGTSLLLLSVLVDSTQSSDSDSALCFAMVARVLIPSKDGKRQACRQVHFRVLSVDKHNLPRCRLTTLSDWETRACAHCGAIESASLKLLKCGRCLGPYYCSRQHQQADWPSHKVSCRSSKSAATRISQDISNDLSNGISVQDIANWEACFTVHAIDKVVFCAPRALLMDENKKSSRVVVLEARDRKLHAVALAERGALLAALRVDESKLLATLNAKCASDVPADMFLVGKRSQLRTVASWTLGADTGQGDAALVQHIQKHWTDRRVDVAAWPEFSSSRVASLLP